MHSRSSKRKLLILFSAIVFLFPAVATLLAREWSSADGKFKVEAEFVALRNGKVVLEKKNGEIISVPLERLSEADIAYVEEQTGAEIPKKVSPSSKEKEDIFGAADDDGKPEMKERGSTEVPTKSSNSDSRFGLVQPIKLKGEKESDPAGICRTLSKEDRGKGSIAFSADGAFLVCTFSNATMKMYDVNNSTTVTTIPELRLLGEIKSTRFTDNGKMLLTGSEKGIILCWTVSKDGQLESTTQFAGHTDDVTCISIAKDNNLVISGGHDKKARVWQISDSKELAAVEFKSELSAVWVSPDGNEALATDGVELIRIDLKTKRTASLEVGEFPRSYPAAFSRDGKLLAIIDYSGLKVYNTKTGAAVTEYKDARGVHCMAFSLDSKKMLTVYDGVVSVWDPYTGNRLEAIPLGTSDRMNYIVFSPDNWHFAVAGNYAPLLVLRMGRK